MVIAVLKLFKAAGLRHALIIADSSDVMEDAVLQAAAESSAIVRRYPPSIGVYDKLADVVASITTPFVLTVPDKKLTFLYGVDEMLAFLQAHDDFVAASGYVLRYAMAGSDADIYRVHIFTPSIVDEHPLRRLYESMRRYQPSIFALFRREALLACVKAAGAVRGLLFQEITFMNACVLQGKVARLPVIFGLHGFERSHGPIVRRNPMYWFLDDSRSFFGHYASYCEALTEFILSRGITPPKGVDLHRLLDLVHASWLGHNVDAGMINHTIRGLLGDDMRPLVEEDDWPGPRPIGRRDRIDQRGTLRCIWRQAVLEAEPRHEIKITGRDINEVNDALAVAHAADLE
jgi:glycosyltransferase domain-containing protein